MTSPSRFALPITELEDGARTAVSEQVQEQPEARLHESWSSALPTPDGAGGGGGGSGCDGE